MSFLEDMDDQNKDMTLEDHVYKFINILFIISVLVILLTINFIALSTSLNMNKNEPYKYLYAIVAFFFGLIYMITAVFYYRLSVKKEPITFDKDNIFPF